MIFGADYYPEHREREYWRYDLENMAKANINALRVGEFAWKRFEPEDGVYDFEWMDSFLEMAEEKGIKLLICPPLRTAPAWLVEEDPSILIENNEGVRLAYGSRYTFCINNPRLIEKSIRLAEELGKHYGNNDNVLGFHLDNEYGDEPDCHCDVCTNKWRMWLKNKYKKIDTLNKKWGTVFWGLEYDSFDQVQTPKLSKVHFNPAHIKAWREFRSECTVNAVKLQADAVRKYSKNKIITTNNQGIWASRTDYFDMAKNLTTCGMNYYPLYGDKCMDIAFTLAACRGYKGQNFQVHELRNGPHMIPGRNGNSPKPGELERLTLHVIGNGADAVFYFRWKACPFGQEQVHGSITGYDGKPKRMYNECKAIGEKLKRISPILEGTQVKSDIAVLYDFETRWIIEQESNWKAPKRMYINRCLEIYNTVRKLGRNCDVVGREQDFDKYKVIIVPMLDGMNEILVEKLCSFVEKGGNLIFHPLSGIRNEDCRIYPKRMHQKLMKLFGIDITEFTSVADDEQVNFEWNNKKYEGTLFCDLSVSTGAEILGEFKDIWFESTPCVLRNKVGDGYAYYISTFPKEDFYEDFFEDLFIKFNIPRILGTHIPKEVEVVERSNKNGMKLSFLINTTGENQNINITEKKVDIWNDEEVIGNVEIKPYGVRILK